MSKLYSRILFAVNFPLNHPQLSLSAQESLYPNPYKAHVG